MAVWKRPPVVETLWHSNFGPDVLFETLELDISSVQSSTGCHGRTPWKPWDLGGHKGQFPSTDLARAAMLSGEEVIYKWYMNAYRLYTDVLSWYIYLSSWYINVQIVF